MKYYRLIIPVFIFVITGGLMRSAAEEPDGKEHVIKVGKDDAEMNAAMAKARSLLPGFWDVFEHRAHGETDFCLKVRIADKTEQEYFWLNNIEKKDGKLFGTINDDPEMVKNVKFGQRIEIPEADIFDWLYMQDGKMVGNYTIRVLFKQMSPKEAETYKRMLAEP